MKIEDRKKANEICDQIEKIDQILAGLRSQYGKEVFIRKIGDVYPICLFLTDKPSSLLEQTALNFKNDIARIYDSEKVELLAILDDL